MEFCKSQHIGQGNLIPFEQNAPTKTLTLTTLAKSSDPPKNNETKTRSKIGD